MKKWWVKGIIACVLMGSTIGINAQNITYFEGNDYGYEVAEEPLSKSISEIDTLAAKEGTFKFDITIPYLGENGYIYGICLSRYDVEGKRGEKYEGRVDLSTEIPVDNYYVQIIAKDDSNYYCLFAKTNNGKIIFTESDLVCTTIENRSSLDMQDTVILPKQDILLQSITHVSINNMIDEESIKLISNKDLAGEVGISIEDSKTEISYGLRNQMSMASDQSVVFGHTYNSSFIDINRKYSVNEESFFSLSNQVIIRDEYGNRLSYLGSFRQKKQVCTLTLSKDGYTNTQEVEVNGSIRFITPSEEGTYHFKLEFDKDLPLPIPTVEGELQVGEAQQAPEETPEESSGVHDFVTNLYRYCMDREPDEAGLSSWTQQLKNKQTTAADTLKFFLNSSEFQNKQTSNQTYIDTLYKVCMGRDGDAAGIDYWNIILQAGESRNNILVKFVDSMEFDNICSNYGVIRGSLESEVADNTEQIKAFITRFYNNCLGRAPEQGGLEYWTQGLKEGRLTGAELGRSFITSTEMTNKNLSTEDYLGVLYDTFMGRSADEGGKQYWVQCIEAGMTREQVMASFIGSTEFNLICQDYGIQVGL